MSLPPKILWAEGQALDVQHFQQLDRYHEARLQHIASVLNRHAWGVHTVAWSVAGLASNSLRAATMSLIFQDGEIYQAPHSDALPLAVDLSKLPADAQSVVFYAALAMLKEHGGNLSDAPRDNARYVAFDMPKQDLYTDGIGVDVSFMQKDVQLLAQDEARASYVSFPVVKVRRKSDGTFEIDPTFMPPSVSLHACPALQEMLRNLLARLAAKTEALYQLQRQPTAHAVEPHSGGIASFLMLNTISAAGANLNLCAQSGHEHPARLFAMMTTLAGGLMAFSTRYAVSDLPAYEHDNPGPGFHTLNAIIGALLDTVVSSKYLVIPLTVEQDNGIRHGHFDAARIDPGASLYLAVSANMPAPDLVASVPRLFKVGAPDDVQACVLRALYGLPLMHMAQVPVEVPVRPNTYYFAIENKGERYEAMLKAQTVTIYAPGTIDALKIELFAVTG